MNKVEIHLNRLFRDIPESRRKIEMIQEISQDLNDKVADLVSQGHSEDEAIQKVIADFGDISEIQNELMGGCRLMKNRNIGLSLTFSLWGSFLISALMIFINLYYTPNAIWFVFPLFTVIWWPLALFFVWYRCKNGIRIGFPFSVAGAVLIIALMIFINSYYTPKTLWCVYPIFAVVWWPVAMFFNRLRHKDRKDDTYEYASR